MNSALLPLLLVAVLAIPLILGSRKQKKLAAEQQSLQSSLAVGDRVMTTSGLYGYVSDIDDETTIGIEIAPGFETTWLRQAVREKVGEDVLEAGDDLTAGDHEGIHDDDTTTAEVAPPLDHGKK